MLATLCDSQLYITEHIKASNVRRYQQQVYKSLLHTRPGQSSVLSKMVVMFKTQEMTTSLKVHI